MNQPPREPLDYGYFTTLDNRDNRLPYREVLDNLTEQTKLAEQLGFGTVWTGEHHFGHEGIDIHPNPIITGAHLAAHTETIRIGFAGLIVTGWHPLRMAEDVALLDQLTGGRVECGMGRGIAVRELVNMNRDSDRRNDKRNWALFRETVDIVKKAWTEDAFTYDGVFYQWPARGVPDHTTAWYPRDERYRSESGEYIAIDVVPKPFQKPYPPLWNVVDGTSGFRVAAELGLKPAGWLRSTAGMAEAFEAYREGVREFQGRELELGQECGMLRAVVVADTMEEARRIAEEPVSFYFGSYVAGHRGRKIFVEPGEDVDKSNESDWFDFLSERDHILVGTPETVAEQLSRIRATTGVEHFLTLMTIPGIDHRNVMRSIELFGSEVKPLVAKQDALPGAVA
ncbi:MAG: LLM class flavin-dependent oxidoreductase [Actinobacteria bacterium]|nr:LLM class flavin-dependent oxidoreductase [Actinomycetota bacterium]